MSLGRSLLSLNRGLVGKDFRGDVVGNLERKTTAQGSEGCTEQTVKMQQQCQLVYQLTRITVQDDKVVPVQMAIVFKVLCPMASFDVFNDMGLEELPEQLQRLVASHLGPKVVVASQQLVQIINSLGSCETAIIVAEVCPVPFQRHASTEEFNGFIPLQNKET